MLDMKRPDTTTWTRKAFVNEYIQCIRQGMSTDFARYGLVKHIALCQRKSIPLNFK